MAKIIHKISKRRADQASGKSHAGIERAKKEEQEFGAGRSEFIVCSDCDAVYYEKSWHHGFTDYKHLKENKRVNFAVCPACQMIKDQKFEGKVVFENVPSEYKEDILNNIKNTGERAHKRDPMDRIIDIKESEGNIEVFTTENQLARIIARQIASAYKNTKTDIKWSKEESAARIVVGFL